MKKQIGIIVVGIVVIGVLIVFLGVHNREKKDYVRPDDDYIAMINHREMLGMDAGTEYIYYIYKEPNHNKEYFYIKSEANITLAGAGEQKDVGSGSIKNKNDLKKIML